MSLIPPRIPDGRLVAFTGCWHVWMNDPEPMDHGECFVEDLVEQHSQEVPYGDVWMATALVEAQDYVLVEREEYVAHIREHDDLKARVAALESAFQHRGQTAIPQVTTSMKEAVLTVSRQVFGSAALEPSEAGDHYRVKVPMPSAIAPSEGAKLIAKWLRDLRAASPKLAEGVFQLDMVFE